MSRRDALLLLAGLFCVLPASAGAVISPSGFDARVRLDWEASQGPGGRPVISGYVYNDSGLAAINVRVAVHVLDASGQVIERAVGFVVGGIPAFNRSYFSVPLRAPGADYRVTVTSLDWKNNGF